MVDLTAKLFVLDDFNIQIDCVNSEFVEFMETLFSCVQQVKQSATDWINIRLDFCQLSSTL